MLGFLMMGAITIIAIYLIFAKIYPALAFRYAGTGERKARAEYGRIKRENPTSPQAQITEAEFVENFVRNGPSPWKYAALMFLLVLVGIPISCVVGMAGFMR
jgi:hypothetical protein